MSAETVMVYCEETDQILEVTPAEAAAGMLRYARSLGPGSAACGEVERQALEMLKGNRHD